MKIPNFKDILMLPFCMRLPLSWIQIASRLLKALTLIEFAPPVFNTNLPKPLIVKSVINVLKITVSIRLSLTKYSQHRIIFSISY